MEQISKQPSSISPEEKLFNVIKAGKTGVGGASKGEGLKNPGTEQVSAMGEKKIVRENQKNKNEGNKISERHFYIPEHIKEIPSFVIYASLGTILIILIVVAVKISMPHQRYASIIKTVRKNNVARLKILEKITPLNPLPEYIQEANRRNIFQPMPEELEEPAPTPPKEDTAKKLKEISQKLTLRGISWGDDPKAIIKDTDGQIYFLKKGQAIGATGVKIKKIEKEKIIIQYKDAQTEL